MKTRKHPEKISVNIRGKLLERLTNCIEQTGLRTSDVIRNALDDYLTGRNY